MLPAMGKLNQLMLFPKDDSLLYRVLAFLCHDSQRALRILNNRFSHAPILGMIPFYDNGYKHLHRAAFYF